MGSECDALSDVNSEYMKLPLPEGIDDHLESPEYEPSIGFEDSFTPQVHTFSSDDANNLRRVIGDACAATPTVLSVTMPWELPGINLVILGEEAEIVPTPILGPMPISARESSSLTHHLIVLPVLITSGVPIKRSLIFA